MSCAEASAAKERRGCRKGGVDLADDGVSAVRALDRALISQHYVVPLYFLPDQWVAHWSRIKRPATTSVYGYTLPTWWAEA